MKTPTLETDRLILREIHPGDTDVIFNGWMDDENVSRYMWWNASNDINATKEFWGNEYATEAMRTVIKYAVEEMNITEISTAYVVKNRVSGRVLQKLGFQFIGEVSYECNGGDIVTAGRYCSYKVG